jgi:polyisoprenoid-binding protein YceI
MKLKAGTRRNMLSAAVLNAADFPDITVKSVSLSGSLQAAAGQVEISAAGHSSTLSVPLSLQGDAHHLVVAGSMELRQTSLGLTPYSLMGGALQVQDAMQLKFKITILTN